MKSKYTGQMDKECIELCDTLNGLKGVKTVESCCGHLKERYAIWMRCNNFYSLAILARCIDDRYSSGVWELTAETTDRTEKYFSTVCFVLRSKETFDNEKQRSEAIDELIIIIKYWSTSLFYNHLKGEIK